MPFQNGTCLQLAGEVEVYLKWQYLPAACDFLGHADVLLQSLVESLRQSVVVGYVVPAVGGPLSPRWTRQQFSALDSCLTVAGGPLSPHWTRQQFSVLDSCLTVAGGPLSPHWTRQQFVLPGSFGAVRA